MSTVAVSRAPRHPRGVALRALGDERLARLASEGDRQAFAAIYDRHHQALYRYIRSIVRDPDDATDALQSAMVGALRGMPARDANAPLKPWLFRIAHNEAINVLRRRRSHEDIESVATRAGTDLEHDAAARESLRQLVADLRELPERQSGALIMRELSGLDYDEIAAAFEVSPAAAKQTVYEARVALQQRAEGRQMDCVVVRQSLSEGDRRMLRGRKIRAHLSACGGCASFAEALRARPAQLAALAPPLGPTAAAGLLKGILGGGAKGGGEGGAAVAMAGGGNLVGGSLAVKAVAVATVAATAGAIGAAASGKLPGPLGEVVGRGSKESPTATVGKRSTPASGAVRGSSARRKAASKRREAKEESADKQEQAAAGGSDGGSADGARSSERSDPGGSVLPSPSGGRQAGGGATGEVLRTVPVPKLPRPSAPDVTVPVQPPALPKLPNPPSVSLP